MSKKVQEPKTSNEYLNEWCNGKIKFEDALKQFAEFHVSKALEEASNIIIKKDSAGDWITSPAKDVLLAYSVTNII